MCACTGAHGSTTFITRPRIYQPPHPPQELIFSKYSQNFLKISRIFTPQKKIISKKIGVFAPCLPCALRALCATFLGKQSCFTRPPHNIAGGGSPSNAGKAYGFASLNPTSIAGRLPLNRRGGSSRPLRTFTTTPSIAGRLQIIAD